MRHRAPVLPAAGLLTAALLAGLAGPAAPLAAPAPPAAPADCPPGMVPERDVSVQALAAGATRACVPALRPEPRAEVMAMNAQLAARRGGGYTAVPGALEAAVAQHQAVAAKGAAFPATRWLPVGKGPLHSDVPGYTSTNALGLHQLAGRIEDIAYDPASGGHWYAAVANGGIWETTNAGGQWRSIGDTLPTQITGAVAYLKAGRTPVLLAGTGDPAFGGSSFSGLGVFWTTNNGRSWRKATGVPAGTLTFSFGFDPAQPAIVYAATSKGLYRSTDAGRSFRNVVLPTTCTSTTNPVCFFANIVTDVVVRPSDRDGKKGGAVLAAVGWRAGKKLNAVGKPQSPRNGLYTSATGAPGSFRYVPSPSGFAADNVVGRTALSVATGLRQNHDYVYAVVQSAVKFNGGVASIDLPDAASGQKAPNNSVLDGIYGSKDFGKTWVKMADATQLQAPGTGTALSGAFAATYAPGIQAWYNEWIAPDPTTQAEDGTPSRIAFGLEEVWSGPGALPLVPNTSMFKVVGRYFSGASCGGLNLGGLVGAQEFYCPFADDPTKPQGATTHPDQHAGAWVPSRDGGVTLVVGNDGGAYKQTLKKGQPLDNDDWGKGIQNGFNTLLPYDAAISGDGTVVMGLQDNGSAVITPEGKQIMAYGGDGFFVAIDPENSNIWWEEYTNGGIRVTSNGGKSWSSKDPVLTAALFSTPFVMDETNPKHLVIGGNEIAETTYGPATQAPTNDINTPDPTVTKGWKKVYDLGTRTRPGDPTAEAEAGDPLNSMSAVDTRGDATYVAYCGYCDIVTQGVPFASGIATNVGGKSAPKRMTGNGWHIAKARGLPERYVNSVRMDPRNPRTIYVTLGGYGRRWIPPGSLGDDVSKVGRGHVFRSTDAGETFTDISANLPDIGADDAFPFNGGLVVATDLGVYFSPSVDGGPYSVMGKGLPNAPVFRLNRSPRSSRELVAASYGRGVYRIVVPGGSTSAGSGSAPASGGGSNGAAPGAVDGPAPAPAPVAETPLADATVDNDGRSVSSSRPFYRQPVAPVAVLALMGLIGAVALRRRRSAS